MSTERMRRLLLLSICLLGSHRLAAAGPQQPTEVSSIANLLSAADAGRGLSVRLKGVVTYYDHDRRLLFLQDADDGAMVRFIPSLSAEDFWANPGDVVEVEGSTVQSRPIPQHPRQGRPGVRQHKAPRRHRIGPTTPL